MNTLKPFFAFVTVWHDKEKPYNVTDYYFYVVAPSEAAVNRMLVAEVKSYRYWKHDFTIEEIKLDKKEVRRLSSHWFDDRVYKKVLEETLKWNTKRNAAREEKADSEHRNSCTMPLKGLFESPTKIYELAKDLQPGSLIVFSGEKVYIYKSKRKEKTFRESEFDCIRERAKSRMQDILGKAIRALEKLKEEK